MIFGKKKAEPKPKITVGEIESQVTYFFDMYIRKTPSYLEIVKRLEELENKK